LKFFIDIFNPFSKVEKDRRQQIYIIELQVSYEYKEELERSGLFKKLSVEKRIRNEIERRIEERFGSKYKLN
jgi:hypothetical protein